MSVNELLFYPQLPSLKNVARRGAGVEQAGLGPATCTEAEPFALRVLDDSMEPEFRRGCIILIDPTGRATDGSYVLADDGAQGNDATEADKSAEGLVFRQLRYNGNGRWSLCALNKQYPETTILKDLSNVMGVIVQRAGVRRSYHKHYVA